MWDECIPIEFVCYIYTSENYDVIISSNLTYQKANKIVPNYFLEDLNRINIAKFKIQLIHYVYSLLFSKIYSRTNNFGIQKKNNFDFYFATWKNRKTNLANIGAKVLKQHAQSIANQVTSEVLPHVKDPINYQDRAVHK